MVFQNKMVVTSVNQVVHVMYRKSTVENYMVVGSGFRDPWATPGWR